MLDYEVEPGLTLRLWDPADAELLFSIIDGQRDHLGPFLPWVAVTRSPADSTEFIEKSRKRFVAGQSLALAICLDGEIAGAIELFSRTDESRTGEIGYWLTRSAEGRGIITKACLALIAHGFQDKQYNRIVIRAATTNERSLNVARRLGFTYEGTSRQAELINGRWLDLAVYSLLREEWQIDDGLDRRP